MKISIEELPVELWLSILSYLEAHDLLRAFTNLNSFFDRLIASDYLLFNVRLEKSSRNPLQYAIQPYWSDSIINRIISLQPTIEHKSSHIPEFLRWHCTRLIKLKSLTVKLRGREIPAICTALQQLHSLYYLSIECVPKQILLEGILSHPSIRICRLEFIQIFTSVNSYSSQTSSIEILDIKFVCDLEMSIINLLLNRTPMLKRLEINCPKNLLAYQKLSFFGSTFVLPELRTIKIRTSLTTYDQKIFENLHKILPNLKHFSLYIVQDYWSEQIFNNLLSHWWPIIKIIQQINVIIRLRLPRLISTSSTQISLDKFHATLLAMNEVYNGVVNFKWSEESFIGHKVIEISICKFSE